MSQEVSSTNKRIAKNTLFLYVRMLLVMGVSVFTSRVILQTLGVEDYGIYNAVGGIVAVIGVLNGALSSSTSRFLAYELGMKDAEMLKRTFSVSLNLHMAVAFIVLLLAETIGLWFFYEKMLNTFLIQFFYRFYTYRRYQECRFRWITDKTLYKRQLAYSGWEMFGGLASISQGQGINILLNLFFGPMVNAARAVAYQIQTAVNHFVINFLMATRPQVIKSFAEHNYERMYSLTFKSARYSFFLMLALILPICFELRFILNLWLGKATPPDTYVFTLIILLLSLAEVFRASMIMAFHAIGKMKLGNSLNGTIMILSLPISYAILKMGAPAYAVFIVLVIINITVMIDAYFIVYSYVHFNIRELLVGAVLPCVLVGACSVIVPTAIVYLMEDGWQRFIILSLLTEVVLMILILYVGIT
jgi:O-antigen/teichoic acid export membrane protein